jgi:hypothetical protein
MKVKINDTVINYCITMRESIGNKSLYSDDTEGTGNARSAYIGRAVLQLDVEG